jgi:glycosyltransferase involved in cell wall biosynthesis
MTKAQADVSVIVPVCNGEAFIAACLDSLINQQVAPREIIVVNNGSTDATEQIVKNYKTVIIVDEPIMGASRARNRGAEVAQGSVLAFLDVDCIARADWVEQGWNALTYTDADGLVGFSQGISRNIYADFFQRSYDRFIPEIQCTDGRLRKIDTKNFFLRRRVFQAVGGFDIAIGNSEDVDLGIRLHIGGYRVVYELSVVVSHVNPVRLSSCIRVRREQGFFDYMIFLKNPVSLSIEYFPSFRRAYNRYIFFKNPPPSRTLLLMLVLLADLGIWSTRLSLAVAVLLGVGCHFYILHRSLMAFAIFQGKVEAKRVSLGYTTISQVASCGRFSRRLPS